MNFQQKIAEIVKNRQANLPALEQGEGRLRALRDKLRELCSLLRGLGDNDLAGAGVLGVLTREADALNERERHIDHLRRRFERATINIGVSGQARVGKSTLLQSLSGLKDEQIPTGIGLPVTAVRSRIFNQDESNNPYALIKFYDEDSFLNKYVASHLEVFQEILGWTINSLSAFASFKFPETVDALNLPNPTSAASSLKKLREAQEALPRFRSLLNGKTQTISNLAELRRYTAYPTDAEISAKDPDALKRFYLAVEDIQIFCRFPSLPGSGLGLVDLPGLGEASKNVDKMHVDGLENEVDHVIVVLRPEGQTSYVGSVLVKNVDTLCSVQKGIKERGNFASIVINQDSAPKTADLADILRNDINRSVNDDVADSKYTVYTINARQPDDAASLLEKVLERLTDNLAVMDRQMMETCLGTQSFDALRETLQSIDGHIADKAKVIPSDMAQIVRAAVALRKALAGALLSRLTTLRDGIGSDVNSEEKRLYYSVIASIKKATDEQIENGLGKGAEWDADMGERIAVAAGPAVPFEEECHRLRIQIADNYEAMNPCYYHKRLESFLDDVAKVFREKTNAFVPKDVQGRKAIEAIHRKLKQADKKMGHLEQAFGWLLGIHFDFRQNVFPEIREELEEIEAFVAKKTPQYLLPQQVPSDLGEQVTFIKELLQVHAQSANYEISQRLKECADAVERFIFATLEYFDDLILRNEDQLVEFQDFCDQFRAELFPEHYGGVNEESVQYRTIRAAIAATLKLL
jgi:hypothetical protein